MNTVFALLVIFQVKHFLADFPLQTSYMLGKFKRQGWFWPLISHCAVHAFFTIAISAYFVTWPEAVMLGTVDLLFHCSMDRVKASPDLMGRWKALSPAVYVYHQAVLVERNVSVTRFEGSKKALRGNRLFWYCLGIDQAWHHLTHYFIIWYLVSK